MTSGSAWTSTLTTEEFAAIRSVGFEPVGQVFGAAVYNIGYEGTLTCPKFKTPVTRPARFGRSLTTAGLEQMLRLAWQSAISKMVAECAALGGHGVVAVTVTRAPFRPAGFEFMAIGTAVRARACGAPPSPFAANLSGQDFAKLVSNGLMPVCVVAAVSLGALHFDWRIAGQAVRFAGNVEVRACTDLVNRVRDQARQELGLAVEGAGGDGAVVRQMDLTVREVTCSGMEHAHDHLAEVTILGTVITRFGGSQAGFAATTRPSAASRLTLRLNDTARSAALEQGA